MIPAMEHFTCSRIVLVDRWFFVKSSAIAFIMAQTSLLLTYSSSLSPAGGGGGGGGVVVPVLEAW
jgi:hypothetical protein